MIKRSQFWVLQVPSVLRHWKLQRYNQDIGITALAAGSNVELLEKQVREFHPKIILPLERRGGQRN